MNKKFYDLKSTDLKFKNDDYETPSCVLSDLIPYIKNHKTIYDPFIVKV